MFDYPLKLHHTQTPTIFVMTSKRFDYPLKLHHTQTVVSGQVGTE